MADWTLDWLEDVEVPVDLTMADEIVDPDPELEVAPGQESLFGGDEQFKTAFQLWGGMPAYEQADQLPSESVVVNFETVEAKREFERLVDQVIGPKTKSIWFPKPDLRRFMDKRWRSLDD